VNLGGRVAGVNVNGCDPLLAQGTPGAPDAVGLTRTVDNSLSGTVIHRSISSGTPARMPVTVRGRPVPTATGHWF
jgi:hypothetical protein